MSETKSPQIKYDVFVSFRGVDIRRGFLSHLIDSFKIKKINAFVDHNLEKGDEIWASLVEAIEGSSISLIIFSQDYASSRWCLEELVKILECKHKYGRTVIPVFYHVEPTDVRHQSGSYKNAFAEHEIKYENKVQIWKHALNKCADLSGVESSKFQNGAELLKEIVKIVLEKLAKPSINPNRLVGIDEKIEEVESLINKEPNESRLIGIWGMGGMGKTTLAEEVFKKLQSEYEGCYFLYHEREESSRHGIIYWKQILFSKLLGYDVKIETPNSLPEDIARRIGCMKVLIVLDDVNDFEHLEKLLGTLESLGPGSRIIVTTRDLQVLKANKAHEEYQVREFNFDEALELFNLNVFNQSDGQMEYNELSTKMVHYAQGNPLVLKVLARRLRGYDKEVWKSELGKLKKMPPKQVYDVLICSYYDLDRKQQQVFLDLACFFLRSSIIVKVDDLASLLKDDESDNSVVVDLERLKDKALITISEDNLVSMHDILQEMAWEIVRQDSRLWLWDPNDDIYEALKIDKGVETIRSIRIQLKTIMKQKLGPRIFAKMSGLQFLEISGEYDTGTCQRSKLLFLQKGFRFWQKPHNVSIIAKGLQFLASELRFLCWKDYPLKCLPKNLSLEKLVILNLQGSRITKLWHGVKKLMNLKVLDLTSSMKLKVLPDLSEATNLEALVLKDCLMLTNVHPSIFSLPKLEKLDLYSCESLTILTSDSHLCSLSYLNLDYCINLEKFSLISKNMNELRLACTKVKALPLSFGHQNKLKVLHLNECMKLHAIPVLPPFLETLDVRSCLSLQSLPELPHFLKTLDVRSCSSLQSLPKLPPSLKTLNFGCCSSLQSLPELLPFLETLDVRTCSSLQSLPELPPFLKTLDVRFCSSLQSLPELPPFLKTLDVRSCSSLQSLPELPPFLETLDFGSCSSLQSLLELPPFLKTLDVRSCSSLQSLPELPPFLKTLDVRSCSSLQSLPKLTPFLKTLDVRSCSSLQSLPELPPFLETLDVNSCSSLQSLPELPPFLKTLNVYRISLQSLPELPPFLEILNVHFCFSLQSLPELPPFLKTLNVRFCSSLQSLPELPPFLKTLNVRFFSSL